MSFPPTNVNPPQGPESTFIPERVFVLYPQYASIIGFVCNRLLQTLDSVSNAAQYFAVTYPQLDLVHLACHQLLRVLGPPENILNASQLGDNQILAIYPQIILTAPQLKFVWDTYCQLLQVDGSFDESNATQLGVNKVIRDFAISQIDQSLQAYGVLPGECGDTQLGGHQVLADNTSQIQPPADTAQPINVQEAEVPADSDIFNRLLCPEEGCQATFGRQQELKRHAIDVHTLPHRCPFCPYIWSRPDKIKAHLKVKHQDKPQVLNEILPKRGQHLVTYLLATFPEVVQNIQ